MANEPIIYLTFSLVFNLNLVSDKCTKFCFAKANKM